MKDEGKTREQLLDELAALRRHVADLEQAVAERRQMEQELLTKNDECRDLTTVLDQKYREIKWHDEIQTKYLAEAQEKKVLLEEYVRLLRRKSTTSRILVFLLVVIVLCVAIAASLGKTTQFLKSIYEYNDTSYRPMDTERRGESHPLKTGKVPGKQ